MTTVLLCSYLIVAILTCILFMWAWDDKNTHGDPNHPYLTAIIVVVFILVWPFLLITIAKQSLKGNREKQ